jgi:hypothetical protein
MKFKKGQIIRKDADKVIWVMATNPLFDTVGHVHFKGKLKMVYRFNHSDQSQEIISRTTLNEDELMDYFGRFKLETIEETSNDASQN